jgi:hypothetical protein
MSVLQIHRRGLERDNLDEVFFADTGIAEAIA